MSNKLGDKQYHIPVGTMIDDFLEVTEAIRQNQFFESYEVFHHKWKVRLAMKALKPELGVDQSRKEIFVKSCQKIADMGLHPNIASLYYVHEYDDLPLLLSEHVAGYTLEDWLIEKRVLSWKRIMDIAIQILDGCAYAHSKGIYHRNLKPDKCMVTQSGSLKLLETGITPALDVFADPLEKAEEFINDYTRTIVLDRAVGSPAYTPPEIWKGHLNSLGPWTDIYSFGALLYELCCERTPFDNAEGLKKLKTMHLVEDPPHPKKVSPDIPDPLAEFIMKCLDKRMQDRPQNCEIARSELTDIFTKVTKNTYRRMKPIPENLLSSSLNNRALAVLDQGDTYKAQKLWETALKKDINHIESNYNLGLYQWRNGIISEDHLVHRMFEMSSIFGDQWYPSFLLGLTYLEIDDYDSAVQTLMKIINKEPGRSEIGEALALAQDLRVSSMRLLQTIHSGEPIRFDSVALSRNRKYIISGAEMLKSGMFVLILWEESTGRRIRTMNAHDDVITVLTFSRDGKYILSGSADTTMKLWDVSSGRCLKTFKGHTGKIKTVYFSKDGTFVLSGSSDNTLKLWEINTGNCLKTFEGHTGSVNGVKMSKDSARVISISRDKTIRIWDSFSTVCTETIEGHNAAITCLSMSRNGKRLLTGSFDRTLKLWNLESGALIKTFKGHTDGIVCAHLTYDGKYILSGAKDKVVKLWDIETAKCLHTYRGQKGDLYFLGEMKSNWYAFSFRSEDTCELWELSEDVQKFDAPYVLCTAESHLQEEASHGESSWRLLDQAREAINNADYVYAVDLMDRFRKEKELFRSDVSFAVWSLLYRKLPKEGLNDVWEVSRFSGHKSPVKSLSLSEDSRYLVSGSSDRTLRLWDLDSGRSLRIFKGHSGTVTSVAMGSNNFFILSGSTDKTVKLWDISSGRCRKTFEGHSDIITSVCLTPDCRVAISGSGGSDGTIKMWDVNSGRCIRTLEGHNGAISSLSLSLDGRYLLSGSTGKNMILWDIVNGVVLRTFTGLDKPIYTVLLSENGYYAFSGTSGGLDQSKDQIIQWTVLEGKSLRAYSGHNQGVGDVVVTGDNKFMISGGGDQKIIAWDAVTGRRLKIIDAHDDKINSLALSKDARYIISAGHDGSIKLWALDWKLEQYHPLGWDDSAKPFLEAFLTLQTPHEGDLPKDRQPSNEEVTRALNRKGEAVWTLEDFEHLLETLACAGFGWLDKSIIRRKLLEIQKYRKRRSQERVEFSKWARKIETWKPPKSDKVLVQPEPEETPGAHKEKSIPPPMPVSVSPKAPETNILSKPNQPSVFSRSNIKTKPKSKIARKPPQKPQPQEQEQPQPAEAVASTAAKPEVLNVDSSAVDVNEPFFKKAHTGLRIGREQSPFKGRHHDSAVRTAAFSANGLYALSGGNDKILKIWSTRNRSLFREFKQHEDILYDGKFSPDGTMAVSCSGDGTLKIWNLSSGLCLKTLEGHKKAVFSSYWSLDGKFILSGSEDRTLKLWEVESGRCIQTFTGHFGWVQSVLLSHDNRLAVSASQDRTIKIWEVNTTDCLQTLRGHSGVIRSLDLSGDGRLASGSRDSIVKLWEINTGRCIRSLSGHNKSVNSVKFTPDGRFLLSGAGEFFESGDFKIWDTTAGHSLETMEQKAGVISIDVTKDGKFALTGGADNEVRLWTLDWELEDKEPEKWDEGARPYLKVFLNKSIPYSGQVPFDHEPTPEEVKKVLVRKGRPGWDQGDLTKLMNRLGAAGYGWLTREGVEKELKIMEKEWEWPEPIPFAANS